MFCVVVKFNRMPPFVSFAHLLSAGADAASPPEKSHEKGELPNDKIDKIPEASKTVIML